MNEPPIDFARPALNGASGRDAPFAGDEEAQTEGGRETQCNPPATPIRIVDRWRDEGALVRVPTGIRALDDACRGGLALPWRMLIIGAPSAGKTAVATIIADTMAREAAKGGVCVGILAVDEEPDDVTVRLAQIAGFTVAQAELRDPAVLDAMAAALTSVRVRLYDGSWTIEAAGADLTAWADSEGRRAALFIDSIQAARSARAAEANSPRELVEANVSAMRAVCTGHRMLVVATSEANRASYRNEQAAEQSNDLAAGAESRAIEFGAQTLLMLRTPKGHADVVHVRIVKNRRARVGEFWLHLDRERHSITECDNPEADPEVVKTKGEGKRSTKRGEVEADARSVLGVIVQNPGIGSRALRAKVGALGLAMGVPRLDVALERLAATGRIENRSTVRGQRTDAHYHAVAGAVAEDARVA